MSRAKESAQNPFNITRAAELSDDQIGTYWVDISGGQGLWSVAKPTSPVPMYILGGKGSGKTHLMRYLSYPVQKLRHDGDASSAIREEGYVGIYFRCAGLNANRFSAKNQSEELWSAIFAYFMELWCGQLVLQIATDAFFADESPPHNEAKICDEILALFDKTDSLPTIGGLRDLSRALAALEKSVNVAVNNCPLDKPLEISILATSGRLIFGVPQVLSRYLDAFHGVQFLYLIDEFENLSKPRQIYFNTLLREKEAPCSFKIGARLFGVKSHETLSAGEVNVEGSEYEALYLDSHLRKAKKAYKVFAKDLCSRRLEQAGFEQREVKSLFEVFGEDQSPALFKRLSAETARPYFARLRRQLLVALQAGAAPGVRTEDDVDEVVLRLQAREFPLLEKNNILILYQDWHKGRNLMQASQSIHEHCLAYTLGMVKSKRYKQVFSHFKGDLLAQLFRECKQKQMYAGFETFVEMSDGVPRNLLTILKHIFDWSSFNGEHPLEHGAIISLQSEQRGVREASEWFYRDARPLGSDGRAAHEGVQRLATLLREIRFSDKPTECSPSTFSADLSVASDKARHLIDLAEKWSLLIPVEKGQRDRNSMRIDSKYQVNRMLAPYWDLPIGRRGAVPLSADELNAIFDPYFTSHFKELLTARVKRMMAPFFGRRKGRDRTKDMAVEAPMLWGDDDD